MSPTTTPAGGAAAISSHLRALYRLLLRELPPHRTPLRQRIRHSFSPPPSSPPSKSTSASIPSPNTHSRLALRQRQEAEQFIHYLRAQRRYMTLLERYNPGIGMDGEDEGERVRLTARRVGMEMPRGWYEGKMQGDG